MSFIDWFWTFKDNFVVCEYTVAEIFSENAIKKITVNFIIDNIFLKVGEKSNSNVLNKFIYL